MNAWILSAPEKVLVEGENDKPEEQGGDPPQVEEEVPKKKKVYPIAPDGKCVFIYWS